MLRGISLTFEFTVREASRLERQMDLLPRIHIQAEFISAKQSYRLRQKAAKQKFRLSFSSAIKAAR